MSFDARAFLTGLFQPELATGTGAALEPDPAVTPADLPPEWREHYEERAAIMEHDGHLPREYAEAMALDIIVHQMRQAGIT